MKNIKKNKSTEVKWPTITEIVKETLDDLSTVIDNKQTIREFNKLQYEDPKLYAPEDIVRLRTKKLKMSQSVFAQICNTTLVTLQKWEQGTRHPTQPINRLFQFIEHDALSLIER